MAAAKIGHANMVRGRPVSDKAKGNEGPRFSMPSKNDKMALAQISFTSILLLVVMLPMTLFITGGVGGSLSVTMDEEKVSIDAPPYGWGIAYSDIDSCEPNDGTFHVSREFGLSNHEIIAGRLYNDEVGSCNGAIYKDTGACVLIRTYDGTYYVFNDASVEGTASLHAELLRHLPTL